VPLPVQARADRGKAAVSVSWPHPAGREGEAVTAQRDGFLGAQRRVIQAAEERGQFGPNSADLFQDGVDLPGARDNPGIGRAGGSRHPPLELAERVDL
jgi:hypothetical protein